MSRINCFNCIDGKENHCDGCNLYKISLNINKTIEALRKLEQHCGNCTYHDELNFHNPTDCWCSKRHMFMYADMHCADWSDEE